VRQRDRAREKLGDVISTLLIIVGAMGLAVYLLYMWNLNNIVLHYALLALIIAGGFLAFILAALYLTKGVEPQGGTEQLRAYPSRTERGRRNF
jgi:uncharacterized membrane-anchored protein YitT (DUF2179 family)